jgi:Tol biopolymer transport system component
VFLNRCDVFLIDLNGGATPSASPRQLTRQRSVYIDSIAWTRDASAVVYAAAEGFTAAQSHVWRVRVDGTQPPERVEVAGSGAVAPAIARSRDRLAFSHVSEDADVYRFEVGRPVQLIVGSTFAEMEPRLSPDARRLVFGSVHFGDTTELWIAGADGSNPQQLTHLPKLDLGSPSWSPDGRQIVFDAFGPGIRTITFG